MRLISVFWFVLLVVSARATMLGPVNGHMTRCLSERINDCEMCFKGKNLAMCHRLAIGKYMLLVNWRYFRSDKDGRKEAKDTIVEACDHLMGKDPDMQTLTCMGFVSVFVNEASRLEGNGTPTYNARAATNICVSFFQNNGGGCATASFVVNIQAGVAVSVTIIINLPPGCVVGIQIFNGAFQALRGTAGFSDIFEDSPDLNFNPVGDSTLTLPFVPRD